LRSVEFHRTISSWDSLVAGWTQSSAGRKLAKDATESKRAQGESGGRDCWIERETVRISDQVLETAKIAHPAMRGSDNNGDERTWPWRERIRDWAEKSIANDWRVL